MNRTEFHDRVVNQQTVWCAGAYDALSAKLIEAAGFEAVFTSGFCVSAALLGQPDVELYTMSENLDVVSKVVSAVHCPVVADIDTAYGNAINVMRTVSEFERAGVYGVVIEDQRSPKSCPAIAKMLEILPVEEAAGKIRAAVSARKDPNLLIVARTDAVDESEAIARAKAYVAAGADLIQPISRTFKDLTGLQTLRRECGVPLSVQMVGWYERDLTPQDVETIGGIAVFPVAPLMTAVAALIENLAAMRETKSLKSLPRHKLDHVAFEGMIGFEEITALQKRFMPASA